MKKLLSIIATVTLIGSLAFTAYAGPNQGGGAKDPLNPAAGQKQKASANRQEPRNKSMAPGGRRSGSNGPQNQKPKSGAQAAKPVRQKQNNANPGKPNANGVRRQNQDRNQNQRQNRNQDQKPQH